MRVRFLIAAMTVLLGFLAVSPLTAATSRIEPFGTSTAGLPVSRIIMTNDRKMRVVVITYGATLTAVEVPDRNGKISNIVLSLPDMPSYQKTERRWGGIVGRYAGRIGGASFVLDSRRFALEPGRNGVTLHGGSNSYDKRIWEFRTVTDARSIATVLTLDSPAGDQGFPGALKLEVTYRLMKAANVLKIEYRATTTAPTMVNFTNHAFFNLGGAGTGTILGHELKLTADRFAETDARKIPTGQLLDVAGTPLDFRQMVTIGNRLDRSHPLLAPSMGFDHSYAVAKAVRRSAQPVAFVREPLSGRTMIIATTEPALQFNSGNGFDGKEIGSEGMAYPIYAGLALETQHLPDSPNQPYFPSTRLDPGKGFYSVTVFRFGVE
jgi:aldose 1-epimerase